jgi:hypothetical protein
VTCGERWQPLTTVTPERETVNPNMDDASPKNIRALVDRANRFIDAERNRISELAKQLAPKAPVQPKTARPEQSIFRKMGTEAGV